MRPLAHIGCVLLLAGCEPDFLRRSSLIEGPRLIAVVSEPAESLAEEEVAYRAFAVSPDGPIEDPALAWALCRTPKPPTESRSVDEACLGDGAVAIGSSGAEVSVTTPEDACFLFGPDTPPGDVRPRDPDLTGGFYLPLRATLDGRPSFALHRIQCDLANAPVDVSIDYKKRYPPNTNPVIDAIDVPEAVAVGAVVDLELRWTAASVERFPVYDREARVLIDRDEVLSVSWFATAGSFDHDAGSATNRWTAPDAVGPAHLWAVLRDDRGGAAVWTQRIDVE